MRRSAMFLVACGIALTSCGDDRNGFEAELDLDEHLAGDIIALRADGVNVEYVSRRTGEIFRHNREPAANNPELIVTVDVGTDGEQRGLLGHAVIDERRFAAWTQPDTFELVVGEVTSGGVDRIVWGGTATSSKAVGGHLETFNGQLLLGVGSLTRWALDHGSGALVLLDPDGSADQTPTVMSDGWNNPFAFTVTTGGDVWVADNAPDGSDLPVAERDRERIASPTAEIAELVEPPPQRAPSAVAELPDGRLAVCGFLDDELRAYRVNDDDAVERAGTIGPCLTGVAVLADGSIVTSSIGDVGPALLVRPA